MKKILALTLAAVFICLSVFTLCVSAADGVSTTSTEGSAYKLSFKGPSTMVTYDEDTFTISIDNIDLSTGGLKEIAIALTYSKEEFRFVSVDWTTPSSGWRRRYNEDTNGDTTDLVFIVSAGDGVSAVTTSGAIVIKVKMRLVAYTGTTASISVKTASGTAANASYGEVKGTGNDVTVKRAISRADKPAKLELLSKGETSVMVKRGSEANLEYSCDLINWQAATVFDGLVANGIYTFYARVAAQGEVAASEPSEGLVVTLGNGSAGPQTKSDNNGSGGNTSDDEPQIMSKTDTVIMVKPVAGYEYSLDNKTWNQTGIFTGLSPAQTYGLFWRKVDQPSTMKMMFVTTAQKSLGKAPAPTVKAVTATTIELNAVSGCEYSKDGKTWQASPLFMGLEEGKMYFFYQRYAGTSTTAAGDSSDPLFATTKKSCVHANVTTSEKAATCTEEGYIIKKCNDCGATIYTETIGAKGHDWEWKEVAATCTTAGSRGYVCRNCGTTRDTVTIPATGHTAGAEATCTEPQKCVTCGTVLVAAKGHTPGAAATCTTPQVCTVCGEVIVNAKGHVPSGEATCTTPQKCLVCGEVIIPAKGHTEGAPVVEVEPTKSKEGSQVIKCTVCGEIIRREAIPKLKGSGTVVTIVIILAVVAILAAGGAVFFVLSKNGGAGNSKGGGRASIGSQK